MDINVVLVDGLRGVSGGDVVEEVIRFAGEEDHVSLLLDVVLILRY